MTEARLWRPCLPKRDYEWVIVPAGVQNAFLLNQAVAFLPTRQEPWTAFPAEVVSPRLQKVAKRAAMPWWSASRNVVVLRDEAIRSVGTILEQHGQLLPLDRRNAELVLFAAPLVERALLVEESDLDQSPNDSYAKLRHGVFDAEQVGDRAAFVVPVGRNFDLILTDTLVEEMRATGDTSGTDFEPIGVMS